MVDLVEIQAVYCACAYYAVTAHHNELPLITSDKYLIEHQKKLGEHEPNLLGVRSHR